MSDKPIILERQNVDFIGMLAGFLCASHCLLSATAPIWISVLGLGSLFSHTAEIIFVLFGITTAVFTMLFGVHHQSALKVRGLLIVGVIALMFSQYLEMSSGHHDHHDEDPQQVSETTTQGVTHQGKSETHHQEGHHDEGHHDEGHHKEGHHEEEHSSLPLLMSIFGGLMIVTGHFTNIRSQRLVIQA